MIKENQNNELMVGRQSNGQPIAAGYRPADRPKTAKYRHFTAISRPVTAGEPP